MSNKFCVSLVLTILLVNYIKCDQIDYCTFGLSSNLNGVAYTIINHNATRDNRGDDFQEAFEDMIREDKVAGQFRREFGKSLDTVKKFTWYYSFRSLGVVNISTILPSSLHCIYVYDRELFTERYELPTVTAKDSVKFVLNEVFYQAIKEQPTRVRLPLLEVVNNQEAVGCNFATAVSGDEDYFLVQCMHDATGKSWKSTKIIEKSTKKEICVSDVIGACDSGESENLVDASITLDVDDEDELKKLISSMNCINCNININVQPKP